jgi:dipeptidyl aminopeptidase/acylaminoacyl peptidase
MNSALLNGYDVRIRQVSADGARIVAFVSGPRGPGAFYLYDRTARRFDEIGLTSPHLTPARLAAVESLDVLTRDRQTIRAYLTVPNQTGPRPLVVVPHGGPEARDVYGYDLLAQVFAAQGWLVLQPNFRGSGGYGAAFADAGRRHWGDLMQADVEDALDQVLATGRVDASKVAIWGASYGGYAALAGAIRRPAQYKAVVAVAGVTDLPEFLRFVRDSDGADSPSYEYWTRTIGDAATERDALSRISPRANAATLSAPVLLIHGGADRIVPPSQSRQMAAALRQAGKSVEHLEIREAGHRNWAKTTLQTVLERSVAFLQPRLS